MNDYATIPVEKLNKLYRIAVAYDRMTLGGLASQAFTSFICIRCDATRSHPNGNTPSICRKCVDVISSEYKKEQNES